MSTLNIWHRHIGHVNAFRSVEVYWLHLWYRARLDETKSFKQIVEIIIY